ncbi:MULTISPECIES: cytochrome c nitrite reductase subunit NrfD [Vibrio]|uniref:Cytochrome c nitrite reductase subunit NrfD n=1 Tax=Vibrio algicola TaxID=2662262 RepID=A0A5Q0TGI4_9VIBR|nr:MULTISPECIES: cytochrome c nitrite reductase subunit NrfD [Vibrio]MBD1575674.1 cytochrome c nitrite reductase subunit NrfD [Vibrio sp. S11_S32]
MSDILTNAFHFDSLVWDWIIALYLFLTGMSAGGVMISIYLKRKVIEGPANLNGILRANAIFAPLGIIFGLSILVYHLQRPWTFWKIMLHYNPTSVMSMGVMLFQIYMVVLFIWLGVMFKQEIYDFMSKYLSGLSAIRNLINTVLTACKKFENGIEIFLVVLAVLLAAYTGFLLSALKTYPLLNNPVLPVLFLFSSLSSGAAACILFGVAGFKEPTDSPSIKWIHGFERPVVLVELFVLCAFFVGLYFGGGQKEVAVATAIGSGFWATWFWIGVVGIGMLLPLALNHFSSAQTQHKKTFVIVVTGLSLLGVLMLRTFILYAGQMTVV